MDPSVYQRLVHAGQERDVRLTTRVVEEDFE